MKQQNKETQQLLSDVNAPGLLPYKAAALKSLSEKKNNSTETLVSQLFNLAGGTFTVTNAPNNPARQLTPEHIGRMLRIVADESGNQDYVKMQTRLLDYLVSLSFKDPSNKLFKAKDFNPLVKSIVGSLQECLATDEKRQYAPNTTQGILLGYLLAISNTRQDLATYFSGFQGYPVVLPKAEYSQTDMAKIMADPVAVKTVEQFADFMCATIYQQKYAASFPRIATNASVNYQGASFTDCMESTMRNMVNIVTYDQVKSLLGQERQGVTMSSQLQRFYAKPLCANPADVSNKIVNQEWVDVVENIPGLAYNRLLVNGFSEHCSCDGAIPVDVLDEMLPTTSVTLGGMSYQVGVKVIDGKKYWLVPKSTGLSCYELMPTASNIVVLMNHLFNLNLFASIDAVLEPDFAQNYFGKMCNAFGWQISADGVKKIADLEKGVQRSIVIQVTVQDKQFDIHLHSKAHGFLSVSEENKKNTHLQLDTIDTDLKVEVQAACVALGMIEYASSVGNLPYDYLLLNPDNRSVPIEGYMHIFADNSLDNEFVLAFERFVSELIISMGRLADNHYRAFVATCLTETAVKNLSKSMIEAIGIMANIAYVKHGDIKTLVLYKLKTVESLTPDYVTKVFEFLYEGMQHDNAAPSIDTMSYLISHQYISEHLTAEVYLAYIERGLLDANVVVQQNFIQLIKKILGEPRRLSLDINKLFSLVINYMKNATSSIVVDSDILDAFLKKDDLVVSLHDAAIMWSFLEKNPTTWSARRVIQYLIERELVTTQQVNSMLLLLYSNMPYESENHLFNENALRLIKVFVEKRLITADQVGLVMDCCYRASKEKSSPSLCSMIPIYILPIVQLLAAQNLIQPDRFDMIFPWINEGLQSTPDDQKHSLRIIKLFLDQGLMTIHDKIDIFYMLKNARMTFNETTQQITDMQNVISAMIPWEQNTESMVSTALYGQRSRKPVDSRLPSFALPHSAQPSAPITGPSAEQIEAGRQQIEAGRQQIAEFNAQLNNGGQQLNVPVNAPGLQLPAQQPQPDAGVLGGNHVLPGGGVVPSVGTIAASFRQRIGAALPRMIRRR